MLNGIHSDATDATHDTLITFQDRILLRSWIPVGSILLALSNWLAKLLNLTFVVSSLLGQLCF
jgi:hypothetical protein